MAVKRAIFNFDNLKTKSIASYRVDVPPSIPSCKGKHRANMDYTLHRHNRQRSFLTTIYSDNLIIFIFVDFHKGERFFPKGYLAREVCWETTDNRKNQVLEIPHFSG